MFIVACSYNGLIYSRHLTRRKAQEEAERIKKELDGTPSDFMVDHVTVVKEPAYYKDELSKWIEY